MAKCTETRTGVSEMNLDLCTGGEGGGVGGARIDFHLNTSHSQDLAGCSHSNSGPSSDCVCLRMSYCMPV